LNINLSKNNEIITEDLLKHRYKENTRLIKNIFLLRQQKEILIDKIFPWIIISWVFTVPDILFSFVIPPVTIVFASILFPLITVFLHCFLYISKKEVAELNSKYSEACKVQEYYHQTAKSNNFILPFHRWEDL
jgi:hypothetical protein